MKKTLNAEGAAPDTELGDSADSSFIPPSSFHRFFWRAVAIVIGGLFIYAGVVKVIDPVEFARDIDNYKMLPWQINVLLAVYLPWLEIFCGLALMARVLYRGAAFILTLLMVLFVVITIVAKARGLDISCGCFGHASKYLSFAWHLVLDVVVLGAILALPRHDAPPGSARRR
ncbi:MAG TPA: MauE/DoxX family redox-associated membrane protein [Chthoniobacterales bacterium]|nr:MauE/DoxX family redox-associated membrane protein [Chthoniobacterales bacterium]